jgi:hypothetical protein
MPRRPTSINYSILMVLSRWFGFRMSLRGNLLRPFLFVFAGFVLVLPLTNFSRPVGSQSTPGNSNLHRARVSPSPPPPCLTPTLQTIYAPTIGLPEIASGKIVFNSRADVLTDVQLTFYTEEGLTVEGPVVQVEPSEIRYVNIATLIPPQQRWRLRWGGVSLSYTGKPFDIWAQITLVGSLNSGSSDVTFSVLNGRGSDKQEAVWWMPRGGRAILALGNSSNEPIQTALEYSNDSRVVSIAPHATELVRFPPRASNIEGRGESVRLTTVGPAGSLKAAGIVIGPDSRVIGSIRFADTKNIVQPHLFATNVRLRGYRTKIVLKNTSSTSLVARPRFRPASGEDADPIELPAVTLLPLEITTLNLEPVFAAAASRTDLETVSVKIVNSGAPGTLIGSINGVENLTGATYEVPLRDSGINRTNGGAYPWRTDGDFTTIVSVTNAGEAPSRFVASIFFPGGKYVFGPRNLAVGESAFFDIKQIRDQQLPDVNGALLPRNVSIGQFRWHWFPTGNEPHMMGRAAVVSRANGISISYSCIPNCYAHGPQYYIDGNPVTYAGAYETMHTREEWCGPSGGCDIWNTNLSGSTVDNTSVASLGYVSDGWTNVNGLAVGETYWWWNYWYGYEYDDGFDCRYAQTYETGSQPAEVRCPKPTGETTSSGGWDSTNPTIHKWNQTLLPSSINFSGRTVTEQDPGSATDGCWFQGSEIAPAVLNGTSWSVGSSNHWGPDYVGAFPSTVTYYRKQNRAPCTVTLPQRMVIDCSTGPIIYANSNLVFTIGSTTVTSQRAGQSASHSWP